MKEDTIHSFLGQLVLALSSQGVGPGHTRYTRVEPGTQQIQDDPGDDSLPLSEKHVRLLF